MKGMEHAAQMKKMNNSDSCSIKRPLQGSMAGRRRVIDVPRWQSVRTTFGTDVAVLSHDRSREIAHRITTGSKQTKQTGINNDTLAHHDAHHVYGRLFVLVSGTCNLLWYFVFTMSTEMDTFSARLASFDIVLRPDKRRSSNSKGPNAIAWPHDSPSSAQVPQVFFLWFYTPHDTHIILL